MKLEDLKTPCLDKNRLVSNIKQMAHHGKTAKIFDTHGLELDAKLRVLPNHACATAAMHNHYYVIDDSSTVVDVWDRINGW